MFEISLIKKTCNSVKKRLLVKNKIQIKIIAQ
jgi:hypothetical protein